MPLVKITADFGLKKDALAQLKFFQFSNMVASLNQ
jgi:hypothetical protein